MTSLAVLGAGAIDARGTAGTGGVRAMFAALGVDAATRLRWAPIHAAPYPDFRRLDPLSRALALAVEAIAWHCVPAATRAATAILFASEYGCLHTDLLFEQSLHRPADIAAGLFAFTLPSTALGVVALRHGLRGPTLALSLPRARHAEVLAHAASLLRRGQAAACLCCAGDWLPAAAAPAGIEPRLSLAAVLVGPAAPGEPAADAAVWLAGADPAAAVMAHLRAADAAP
jgi:hypothetical protein